MRKKSFQWNWQNVAGMAMLSLTTLGCVLFGLNWLDGQAAEAGIPLEPSPTVTVTAEPTPAPTVTVAPEPLSLSDCPTEDSDNCIWRADERSDGAGRSFIAWEGEVYYLDGSWRDYATINGDTFPAVIDGGDEGDTILYCHAPYEVGMDTDDKGNQWAGCM